MPSRIDIRAPATINVLAGEASVSSLGQLPPNGITITDPDAGGVLTVRLVAADASAVLSAAGGGATVTASGNTLSLTGSVGQVNAALASLLLTEPAGATTDTIKITASDSAALTAVTDIAVNVSANYRPAFAAPPTSLTVAPNTLAALAGLDAGAPGAMGEALAGEGGAESLAMTLASSSGLLFLPGYSALDGIAASGLGTGTIELDFTADRLAAADSLIAGLELAAPAGITGLAYALRDASDPLRLSVTNGNITLDVTGAAGPNGSFAAGGGQSVIRGPMSLAAGQTLTIAGTVGDMGGISGAGAIYIAPDTALELPYNGLTLGGSSFDFGTLAAVNFVETGAIVIAEGATFAQSVALGAGALVDFNGNLIAGNNAENLDQLSITLGAGATVTGNGELTAGNFSESGDIIGPGTIFAAGGETLTVDAGSIGGGALVEAAAGGVVVLGPDDALYGVFLDTTLTVDSSVLLSFSGAPGLNQVGGDFADSLDSSGGVFVITGPQAFDGTILNFQPGDRLIFPGLSGASLYDITSNAFNVAGTDADGDTVTYVIDAAHPAGTSPFIAADADGDPEIGLRADTIAVFLDGSTIALEEINASPGVPQPIQGLEILPTAASTLGFTVTLSVGGGVLAAGGQTGSTLTLVAANPTALNAELAALSYTGGGVVDELTISAASGPLAGLRAVTRINVVAPQVVDNFGTQPSAADTVTFASPVATPDVVPAAPGKVLVEANSNFADLLTINGLAGIALVVDGDGTAVFDAAASVSTGGNVVVGDTGGIGTLAVVTDDFTLNGANLLIGGAGAFNGDLAYVSGSLGVGGSLQVGFGATAALDLDGTLSAGAASFAAAGSLLAYNGAVVGFGSLGDAGHIALLDQAVGNATTISLSGGLTLGGTARLFDAGGLTVTTGAAAQIGPDAVLSAASLAQSGGALTNAGTLTLVGVASVGGAGTLDLAGGTLDAAAVTVGAGGTLGGYGIVAPTGSIAVSGAVIASGGTLTLGNDVTNTGSIAIGAGAVLDVVHAVGGGTIGFSGTDATLVINDLSAFSAAVGAMTGSDVIDLVGVAPSLVNFASGSVTAKDNGGNKIGGFKLGTVGGQPVVTVVSDGFGGSLVTLGDEMPCFARGTRLLTPNGYRPVESLSPGDAVITAAGDRRPVRWIGSRTLDFARTGSVAALPVLFMAHALGPGQPARPVCLSPLHAVALDGVLVPAGHLVNGATILRERNRAAVTYFHIELDRHDVVTADGLPCETYLDTGNRGVLYREIGRRGTARRPCAPLVTGGAKLATIRRRLHGIALAAGFSLTHKAVLRAVIDDRTAMPEISMKSGRRIARFTLPPAARAITLLSRSLSPAETDPESEDRRQLALCLSEARAGAAAAELGTGWLPRSRADAGAWMGAKSQLLLTKPAPTLTLTLAAVVQSWQPPPTVARK